MQKLRHNARSAIPEGEIDALRSLVRRDGEDGWGYAAGSDPIAATVVSLDLAETDVIAWRAAVRLTSAIAEGGEAPAVIESLLGRLPEPLVATVTVPPSRSDARTIVAEGRVSGFGALADRFLRTLPGRAGPASPTR